MENLVLEFPEADHIITNKKENRPTDMECQRNEGVQVELHEKHDEYQQTYPDLKSEESSQLEQSKDNMAVECRHKEDSIDIVLQIKGGEDFHMDQELKHVDYQQTTTLKPEDKQDSDKDLGSDSFEMLVGDSDSEHTSTSVSNDEANSEAPLTDDEVEELISEFLEVESKAAEAQESLEQESLARVESDVRAELAENLHGDALDKAVSAEMKIFIEEWESVLDDLETQSALLLEQLDGAGVELPSLYKWVESKAPDACSTEAWKKRVQWVGSQITTEYNQSIRDAEDYLHSCRPVRRKHGRLLENGASGYLARNLSIKDEDNDMKASEEVWKSFGDLIHCGHNVDSTSFGGKKWAAVYLANTPQEAVTLGLQFPGADEVEEIGELEGNAFLAEAIQNETQVGMTEEQKKKYKKVREEDDERITRKLQCHLKKRRKRKKKFQKLIDEEGLDGTTLLTETQRDHQDPNSSENFTFIKKEKQIVRDTSKRPCETDDPEVDHKRCRTVLTDSDEETQMTDIRSMPQSSSENLGSPLHAKKTDIIDVDLLPSPNPTNHNNSKTAEKICCTACSGVLKASEVQNHPILKVIICGSCKFLLVEKMRIEDSFSAVYCCWCGACNDLIHCTSCKTMFCAVCITRNFGKTRLSEIKANGWECCCCSPILLSDFVSECEKLLGYPVVSSSETESAFSDAEANVGIGTRRRRKKAIRRILDDTELGEETKRKIEMEKARQEHLKTMQAQSAGRFCIVDNGSSNETVAECSMDESTNCYIINVAREQDEDPVRIPQSISVKLKPHQVAGIRFMWDNIIQSVKKVKSGDKGLGCILAHTMGLGKTLQVIAFLYTAFRVVDLGLRTALVVTPVNVLHNWRREFAKWQPTELKPLRVLMLEDAPREKRADLLAKWTRKGGVFLIGYAAFRNLSLGRHVKDKNIANAICHALHYGPDVLVCDEAHMIKNTRADITFALKQVKTQRRIALTGSPLQNNLMEYYCMVDFVREGYLGSSHEFRNRFQNPIENGQHANSTMYDVKIMNQRSHILHKQLKGFVQRMDMNVVKKDLPSKTVFVIAVKLSPLQRKLYRKFLDMHGFTGEKMSSERVIRRSCFFAGYQTLAQIWNHPGLLQLVKEQRGCLRREDAVENFLMEDVSSDDNMDLDLLSGEKKINDDISNKRSDAAFSHEGGDWWDVLLEEKVYKEADYSGKMVLLLEILAMSSQIGDKALVFSQSLATLDLIELFLSKLPRGIENKYWKQGKDWYRLDGSTQCAERQKMVEKFNEPTNTRVKCTLISTRAGSLGINLHAANRIIIVDGSWNPTYDLQAIYRAWRYGQTKPVYAYRLMAHGTMEEKIYKRQVTKEGLAARVVDRQQIHRTMSKEEMLHLFDFSDDEKADGLEQSQIHSISNQQKATAGSLGEQKSSQLSNGISCSDKLMQSLLRRYHPRWIANYHEHETLLQENESERLTKEEQEIAWQTFQKSLEWEEVHRVVYDDGETQPVSNAHLPEGRVPTQNKLSSTRAVNQRKCTKLDHLLTLRSQTAQYSGSTTCKVCSQEISWKDFSDGRSK